MHSALAYHLCLQATEMITLLDLHASNGKQDWWGLQCLQPLPEPDACFMLTQPSIAHVL